MMSLKGTVSPDSSSGMANTVSLAGTVSSDSSYGMANTMPLRVPSRANLQTSLLIMHSILVIVEL